MTIVPVMWGVLGFLVLLTVGVHLYQSRLARDEEDQIFLSDGFEHEKAHQTAIAAKVSKIQPVLRTCQVLAAVALVFVIGYYIVDVVNQFK
jgi:divalent metal cation (Fe/Co/Zn/Cd) transporter